MADVHVQEVWSNRESAYYSIPRNVGPGDRVFITAYVGGYQRIWTYELPESGFERGVTVDLFAGAGPSGWTLIKLRDETGESLDHG